MLVLICRLSDETAKQFTPHEFQNAICKAIASEPAYASNGIDVSCINDDGSFCIRIGDKNDSEKIELNATISLPRPKLETKLDEILSVLKRIEHRIG